MPFPYVFPFVLGPVALDRPVFGRGPGSLSGRLAPSRSIAPDGSYVFVLGQEEPGRTGFFSSSDDVSWITQDVALGSNVMRLRARFVGPRGALPSGWSWNVALTNDDGLTSYLAFDLATGVDSTHADLVIPMRGLGSPNGIGALLYVVPPGVGPFDPVEMEIPAVVLDSFVDEVASAPFVANRFPAVNEIEVSQTTDIAFEIISPDVGGIDLGATRVVVGGIVAYDGGWSVGWSGAITSPWAGVSRFVITPPGAFESNQIVTIDVTSRDDSLFRAVSSTWSFTIEDLTAPRMTGASANDVDRVRVGFNEPVRLTSTTAWTLTRKTAPSVNAIVTDAVALSETLVELTTDIPLTRGATYEIEVDGVEDLRGNVIEAPYDRATFLAFEPEFPALRRFELWWMLPKLNRDEDSTRDLYKLIAVMQEVVDTLLADVDRWTEILDVDVAADRYLDQMLLTLGNPFDFVLSTIDKRRLIRVLVSMYRQKGTALGIINAIRFFVGVEVTITAYNDEGWILGDSELGIDTILAPSTSFALYAFDVNSPVILTDEQRAQIRAIVVYLKPAHTHLIHILEPVPPEVIDHVELGLSELGDEFVLHA